MFYRKPEITVMDSAVTAILGQPPGSKIGVVLEAYGPPSHHITAAAYEADE
jgi:hypothetical protein